MKNNNKSITLQENINAALKDKTNLDELDNFRQLHKMNFCELSDALKYLECLKVFDKAITVISNGDTVIRFLNDDGSYEDIKYSKAKDFLLPYTFYIYKNAKDQEEGKPTEIKYFDRWCRKPDVQRYHKEVFLPYPYKGTPPQKNGEWNLWQGIVEPKAFDLNEWHQYIPMFAQYMEIFGDLESQHFILDWFSWVIQNPHLNPQTALVFWGEQGSGKSFFAEKILKALFPENTYLDSDMAIFSQFTSDMERAKFVAIEEADGTKLKDYQNKQKALITGEYRRSEGKGAEAKWIQNCTAFIFTSNAPYSVPVESSDRRFSVFHVDSFLKKDFDFWNRFTEWVKGEGKHYLSHLFLTRDISHFNIRTLFENSDKVNLQRRSLPPVERWLVERIDDGSFHYYNGASKVEVEWLKTVPCVIPRNTILEAKSFETENLPSMIFKKYEEIFKFPQGWKDNWKNHRSLPNGRYIKLPPRTEAMHMMADYLKIDINLLFPHWNEATNVLFFENERKNEYHEQTNSITFDDAA